MRRVAIVALMAGVALGQKAPKPGVTAPGVRIPLERLKPEAVVAVAGSPDWIAIDESVWVSNFPKGTVARIDPKTNAAETIETGKKPCSGLVAAFGSLWVPHCGEKRLARVDLKTGKVTASIETAVADSEGGIAAGAGSIWVVVDAKSTLARIDPDTNAMVATIRLAPGSFTPAFGEGSVWVTSTQEGTVARVDPNTNLVVETVKVGKQPRFLAIGDGAVWVLNQSDGSVSRIDPKKNEVTATIAVGVPGEGGDISAGEGSVWVTAFGYPVSRIDPATNKVVQQFVGEGGDAIRAGKGSVWLSNLRQGNVWRLDPKRVEASF
jgi:virginiamycin B lyase